jgi:hypothetical protein
LGSEEVLQPAASMAEVRLGWALEMKALVVELPTSEQLQHSQAELLSRLVAVARVAQLVEPAVLAEDCRA